MPQIPRTPVRLAVAIAVAVQVVRNRRTGDSHLGGVTNEVKPEFADVVVVPRGVLRGGTDLEVAKPSST